MVQSLYYCAILCYLKVPLQLTYDKCLFGEEICEMCFG